MDDKVMFPVMAQQDKNNSLRAERMRNGEEAMRAFLTAVGADLSDSNLADTPRRVAKMFVCELLAGEETSNSEPPVIVSFDTPDIEQELVVVRDLPVRSLCAHHLLPITGTADIGCFYEAPHKGMIRLPGLSKYGRTVEYFSRRFQLQERLGNQIAGYLVRETTAKMVIVRIKATHHCMIHRGIMSERSATTTTATKIVDSAHWPAAPGSLYSKEWIMEQFNTQVRT